MKERPILFKGDMVRAILDGRKTQTRRVITNPEQWMIENVDGVAFAEDKYGESYKVVDVCPYGKPGDRLYVRETWAQGTASKDQFFYRANDLTNGMGKSVTWRPSIHMPKLAARILLEITDVRVERVQAISPSDAADEGLYRETDGTQWRYAMSPETNMTPNPVSAFSALWNSINEKRGYGWDTNPWVWVIEFRRVPA